jgi:hypothetical protein
MRQNIVLIDFENVQPEALGLLAEAHFRVLLFLGANQKKLSVDTVKAVHALGERATYITISGNGSNALDFHIAYYIGALAAEDPTAYFHIISKDTGFDPLLQHLKSKKIHVGRVSTIGAIPAIKASNSRTPADRAQVVIDKISKSSKPRSVKTLSSTVNATFAKQLTDAEIAAVIADLTERGFITIDGTTVTYSP